MIEPLHLIQLIRLVTTDLKNHSVDAEKLILGTACIESECGRYLFQHERGPARGIFQTERQAMLDNIKFLSRRPLFLNLCRKWINSPLQDDEPHWFVDDLMAEMAWNLAAAVIMCRVHYLRFPEPIPDNLRAQAKYYKKYYNTVSGKATEDDYIRAWHRFVGGNLLT